MRSAAARSAQSCWSKAQGKQARIMGLRLSRQQAPKPSSRPRSAASSRCTISSAARGTFSSQRSTGTIGSRRWRASTRAASLWARATQAFSTSWTSGRAIGSCPKCARIARKLSTSSRAPRRP
eukprot:Amastigsp_a677564_6.p4 type:complete len:123 gc:universal Amastigsp_a677564_6:1039-671(-)